MTHFKIFANCILVKGFTRSLICDLQRETADFIPNDLIDIMERLNNKEPIKKVLNFYGEENMKIIHEYLNYMDMKEYGFYCKEDEFDKFPELTNDYIVPSLITNMILELDKKNIVWLKTILPQIEDLGCKDLVLVFYEKLFIEDLNEIISYLSNRRFKSLEIVFKYHFEINPMFFQTINQKISQLTKIVVFNAPIEKVENWDEKILFDRIFTKKNITSFKSCGVINTNYFNTNLPKVLEAMNCNSCLNMKISIDKNGEIKNCPSMPSSYGNIKDTTLEEALNKEGFKQYWNITKDEIDICKDCEFRYICTDCRAYTERNHINKEGLDLSKPLKCGYDPYTGKWEEWSTNPLKQKAIKYYEMEELVKQDGKEIS